jgi:hypothetical protein
MENLPQAFLDLVGIRQDSWECHLVFIALRPSLNPHVLSTRDQGWFLYIICNSAK